MSPSDVELVSAIVYNVCDRHGRPNSATQSAIYVWIVKYIVWKFSLL